MDFKTVLSILHTMLTKELNAYKANEFIVDFMKRNVATGIITMTVANSYLSEYNCKIAQECWGCVEDQPNQLAHMDLGGCLYNSEND